MLRKTMVARSLPIIMLVAAFMGSGGVLVAGEQRTEREYPLIAHGVLILSAPVSWRDEVKQPPGDLPPTIIFDPKSGSSFSVLITPIWSREEDPAFNSRENIKLHVEERGKALLPTAEETKLELREFRGDSSFGYFYSLTDKAPKPGEWKYLTQGSVGVGNLLLAFTILTHTPDSEAIQDALEMLRDSKKENEGKICVSVPDKPWIVTIDIPDYRPWEDNTNIGNPKQLLAAEAATPKGDISITLWVEIVPEGTRPVDLLDEYAKDILFMTPGTLHKKNHGDWAALTYRLNEYQGTRVDTFVMNAFYIVEDRWFDLHLSVVKSTPEKEKIMDEIASSFEVERLKQYK